MATISFNKENHVATGESGYTLRAAKRACMAVAHGVYLDIYHFSVDVQKCHTVFNSHIAWAISWESGLPMTLIPS